MERATAFTSKVMMQRQVNETTEVRNIGILIFDGHYLVTASVINEIFHLANATLRFAANEPLYRITILSKLGGPVSSSSSIGVMTKPLAAYQVGDFHALFVASNDVRVKSGFDAQLTAWLAGADNAPQRRHGLAPRFDVLLPHSRPRTVPVYWVGSGNGTSWTLDQKAAQMALSQIAEDHGEEMSTRIAGSLQPPIVWTGNSRSNSHGMNTATDKLHESARWIRENFDRDISVSDAAVVAAMSVRNYLRRFKTEFGVTPLEYLMQLRFEAICAMLVNTTLPVDKIARHCGMGNGDRLGRLFRKRYGVSPTTYRKLSRDQ
ncbi:helix-turn-helix domain-containing protein [Burkholderia sp. JP2-270]|uniref:GlxA family transcriptional regulator n=1 Tax=Burkholderia sp. JP2-270 TaxID=2217913 RepID=UPI0013A6CC3B|nr:helix-turn-helix domain-containing protein [Burkholderia sp. JP2-270]